MKHGRSGRKVRSAKGAPLASHRRVPRAAALRPALRDLGLQRDELLKKNRALEEAWAEQQRSSAYYADLYTNAPVAYVTVDRNGVITDLNLTAALLFTRSRERLVGKPFLVLVKESMRQAFLAHMRRCRLEGFAKTEIEVVSGDSSLPAELDSRIAAGGLEEGERYQTIVFDLREQRGAESARAEAEHERRRAEHREAVLRASNEAKDRFLAEVSHELRTPLTPILAVVSRLHQRQDLSSEICSVVEMIDRNVKTEARLIDDLLDVSRMGREALTVVMESVDAHEILTEISGDLESEIRSRQIDFQLELNAGDSRIQADPLRLRQVLWNLILNAIHNTPPGEHVVVSTSNIVSDLRVAVRDTGIGMEPGDVAQIFQPFNQAEPARRSGGLGLGLAIVKGLVEAHGGQVMAFSAGKGQGATFVVELPGAQPAQVAEPSAEPSERTTTKIAANRSNDAPPEVRGETKRSTVLLVEDHADTREALRVLLELNGYEVTIARDVASALEAARQPVDILVCDIGLPDGSGIDLMRRIREDKPLRGIALSGYSGPRDLELVSEAGFAMHLTKPVSAERLLEAIEVLSAHRK